jgi:hypothetical protein
MISGTSRSLIRTSARVSTRWKQPSPRESSTAMPVWWAASLFASGENKQLLENLKLTQILLTATVSVALPESRPMNYGETYSWQEAYEAALMEVDRTNMHRRILEAAAAIEQRLMSPIDTRGAEYKAIVTAEITLVTLRSEWFTGQPKAKGAATSPSQAA